MTLAVGVCRVLAEQIDERVDVTVIEEVDEVGVEVLEREPDREALGVGQRSRHAPRVFCSTITGLSCVPRPSIEITMGPDTVCRFA